MNPFVRAMWTNALRGIVTRADGSIYRQGKTHLGTPTGGFCPLGVLCDIAAEHAVCKRDIVYGVYSYDGARAELPESVIRWAELESHNPTTSAKNYLGDAWGIIGLNDMENWSFGQIADQIEKDF